MATSTITPQADAPFQLLVSPEDYSDQKPEKVATPFKLLVSPEDYSETPQPKRSVQLPAQVPGIPGGTPPPIAAAPIPAALQVPKAAVPALPSAQPGTLGPQIQPEEIPVQRFIAAFMHFMTPTCKS